MIYAINSKAREEIGSGRDEDVPLDVWTRLDHVRNETVIERLKIEKVTVRIRRARLRWYGHIERRGGDHVGLRTLHMALPGNRKRGRPRRRWSDNINEDMENIGAV